MLEVVAPGLLTIASRISSEFLIGRLTYIGIFHEPQADRAVVYI